MVSPVPSFNASALVQPVNVVQSSGTRQAAQGLGQVAQTFDGFANFYNDKIDKQIQRRTREAGFNAALEAGFDPQSVDNPVTMADAAFQAGALVSYGMRTQADIEQTLAVMQEENRNNPAQFVELADAYVASATQNMPIELKEPMMKFGVMSAANIASKLTVEKFKEDRKQQVLLFNERMDQMQANASRARARGDFDVADAINAEIATAITAGRATGIIGSDAQAQLMRDKISQQITTQTAFYAAIQSENPTEVLNSLTDEMLTPEQILQVGQMVNQHRNQMENLEAAALKRQQKENRDALNQFQLNVLEEAESAVPVDVNELRRKMVEDYGASLSNVDQLIQSINNITTGVTGINNAFVISVLDGKLSGGTLEEIDVINAFRDGNITRPVRVEFINSLRINRDRAFTDQSFKLMDVIFDKELPIATVPGASPASAEEIANLSLRNREIRNRIEADIMKRIDSGQIRKEQASQEAQRMIDAEFAQSDPYVRRLQSLGVANEVHYSEIINRFNITPKNAFIEGEGIDKLMKDSQNPENRLAQRITAKDIEALILIFGKDSSNTREYIIEDGAE